MRRLSKSRSQKVLDGVLGGVGEYFGIDPVILRLVYLIFAFSVNFGLAVVLYVAAMVIMPRDDGSSFYEGPSVNNTKLFGGLLIFFGLIFLLDNLIDFPFWAWLRQLGEYLWAFVLIGAGLYLIFRGGKKRVR